MTGLLGIVELGQKPQVKVFPGDGFYFTGLELLNATGYFFFPSLIDILI